MRFGSSWTASENLTDQVYLKTVSLTAKLRVKLLFELREHSSCNQGFQCLYAGTNACFGSGSSMKKKAAGKVLATLSVAPRGEAFAPVEEARLQGQSEGWWGRRSLPEQVREKSSHRGVTDHQALSPGPFRSDVLLSIPRAQASGVDLLEENAPCPCDRVRYLFSLKLR